MNIFKTFVDPDREQHAKQVEVITIDDESTNSSSIAKDAQDDSDDEPVILDDDNDILVTPTSHTGCSPSNASLGRRLIDCLTIAAKEHFNVLPRVWVTAQPRSSCHRPTDVTEDVRVCSYNILCQQTTSQTMYLYQHLNGTPWLSWEKRWEKLRSELLSLEADILCLQEVQSDHFANYIKPLFNSNNYMGVYKKRIGTYDDGCAIFYRCDKFDVADYRVVEYFVAENTNMNKPQIGQIVRFRCKKTESELLIANTHLLFNTNRGDIKIGQLAMLFANIDVMISKKPCPVIIMGDFNIEPKSYVYNFINNGSLNLRGLPRNELSGQGAKGGPTVEANQILPNSCQISQECKFVRTGNRIDPCDSFSHSLKLATVYHHKNHSGNTEKSTYHIEAANPDFIFYSVSKKVVDRKELRVFEQSGLRLLRRLSLPDMKTLKETFGPWPNEHVPSDHIPLVADFLLVSSQKNNQSAGF